MQNYLPSDLTQGINSLVEKDLPLLRSFATVIAVKSEGLYVDVNLDLYTVGNMIIQGVPVLKNAYLNLPIRPGDKVFLTTTTHLINKYFLEGAFIEYTGCESYVAIPCILQGMMEAKEFTNHYTYLNPENTYRELINEAKHEITGETIDQLVKLQSSMQEYSKDYNIKCANYTLEAEQAIKHTCETWETSCNSTWKTEAKSDAELTGANVKASAQGTLTLEGPTIDLGYGGSKIGSLIGQMIDALCGSITITNGGPSTQTGQTLDGGAIGTLQSVKGQLQSVFR